MSEYSKRTVADLQEILKSRGLLASGKKADLIARLTEADKAAESNDAQAEPESEPVVEEPAPTEATAPSTQQAPIADEPEVQADGQATEQSAATETGASATDDKTFTLNLAASDVDREMEKRKARAERFKTAAANVDPEVTETASADTDALKNLERAKRFGTGTTAIGLLDSALPSERGPRGKKRNAGEGEEKSTLDDPGLKQNFNRKGRHGRDKRRKGTPGAKPTGISKSVPAAYSNEKDRQAADARKKRFAPAS